MPSQSSKAKAKWLRHVATSQPSHPSTASTMAEVAKGTGMAWAEARRPQPAADLLKLFLIELPKALDAAQLKPQTARGPVWIRTCWDL